MIFFYSGRNTPLLRKNLKITSGDVRTESPYNFSIHILIVSCPRAQGFFILVILHLVIRTDETVLVLFMLIAAEILLTLSIRAHYLAKVNISALALKFEMQ